MTPSGIGRWGWSFQKSEVEQGVGENLHHAMD
jgi:hypothetical protein